MDRFVSLMSILVDDYDHAIDWYVRVLGFSLIQDEPLDADKRWVIVSPTPVAETGLLLAKAATDHQRAAIGNQAGGRVFLFLRTSDFARDHTEFLARGVRFREEPRFEPYGTVAVFEDLYGNLWDLIGPAEAS